MGSCTLRLMAKWASFSSLSFLFSNAKIMTDTSVFGLDVSSSTMKSSVAGVMCGSGGCRTALMGRCPGGSFVSPLKMTEVPLSSQIDGAPQRRISVIGEIAKDAGVCVQGCRVGLSWHKILIGFWKQTKGNH